MSVPRNDQATLAALAATHLGATWLSLAVLGFVMNSATPQFASISIQLDLPLPWHLRAQIEVSNALRNYGGVLVLLAFAWFVWRLRRRARLEEFVGVAAGLNALAFVLVVAACVSNLVYIQGTLLPLIP